nr:hypothetical protein [Neobacillus sp. Marseille-Q6967]
MKEVVEMGEVKVNGMLFEDVRVAEVGGYSGLDIFFTFKGKLYNFMVAKKNPPYPLNILHRFKEQGVCPICGKMIYPYPIGNQPCLELKKIDRFMLERFRKFLPET